MTLCDACNKQIGKDGYKLFIYDRNAKTEEFDLCQECYERVKNTISRDKPAAKVDAAEFELTITDEREDELEPEQEKEPEQEPAPRPEQSPVEKLVKAKPKQEKSKSEVKNSIDHGKLLALYKAGWKVKDIADELKCDKSTVYNYLTRFREEGKL